MSGERQDRIEVCPDLAALSRRGAELFLTAAAAAIAERGRFAVAISGGSTPRLLYRLLASDEFRYRLDWGKVQIFWADERCVPKEHPDSNYGAAREILLSLVHLPAANIHRIQGELPSVQGADAYEEELRRFFGDELPVFDLILLGVGADGHTASLFPETLTTMASGRLAAAVYVAKFHSHRVTLTLPVINGARRVVFLVAGKEKAPVLREIVEKGNTGYPAALVAPQGEVTWLLDNEAAGNLTL